jgi:hypothetical protein
MNIFVSILYAFLPSRYRKILTTHAIPSEGALFGGILETFAGLALLLHRYQLFITQRLAAIPLTAMARAAEKGGETALMGIGDILMVEYLIHFTTLLLLFITVEGIVRVFSAFGSGECLPSFPLYALALLHTRTEAHGRELKLGKRVPDEVYLTSSGESLQIASCRPKSWNHLTTISYVGEHYELVRTHRAGTPRQFMYILRKKSPSAVIRQFLEYDPEDVLHS